MPGLHNGYERVAEEFVATRGKATAEPTGVGVSEVHRWARSLPRHAVVLDMGCGTGYPLTRVLVDQGHRVHGIDASPSLVAAFRRNVPEAVVACESVETSRFFNKAYDAVLAWGLWFLLSEHQQLELLSRVAGMLKPGGRFLFTAPEELCRWTDILTGEECRSLGAAQYRRVLNDGGLIVLCEFVDDGKNHYFDVAKDCRNDSAARSADH